MKQHIRNFIKLAIEIIFLECFYLFVYLFCSSTPLSLSYAVFGLIILIVYGFVIAFCKKYIIFSKNNIKQNLISIVFIICFLVFVWLSVKFALSLGFDLTYERYNNQQTFYSR